VYILDQVRALEREMLERIRRQGLSIKPQILVITRLIPNAQGTTCNQRVERINGTHHARILRIPFRDQHGILQDWISRWEPIVHTLYFFTLLQCLGFCVLVLRIPCHKQHGILSGVDLHVGSGPGGLSPPVSHLMFRCLN
jgi:hypothetical protein